MYRAPQQYGWLFIILGAFIILLFASDLVVRVLLLVLGLSLINLGLRMLELPDIFFFLRMSLDYLERIMRRF